MESRATELVRLLDLRPHPEGGHYRETWRSPARVAASGRASRSALTTIYFLLCRGESSAWHRVRSDEAWHLYEGGPLELLLASPGFGTLRRVILGPAGPDGGPAFTVPADWWQAARPLGDHALCGCTVGPGFEFEDFTLLRENADEREALRIAAPELASLL